MLAYPANVVQVPIYTGELSYKYKIYIYVRIYIRYDYRCKKTSLTKLAPS